ncbi:staygreen family protein [Terrisporobacter sp.]|nr:staygreen family protein [Terrisporobacter sp.]
MKVGDYMEFDPSKLETTFIPPMTPLGPIEGRKYTLTHSDTTGMLFLDIGPEYNYSAINEEMRDELLGKYKRYGYNSYILIFYAYVGDSDYFAASMKYGAFKYHLPFALQAIFYGDKELLNENDFLLDTPIYVKFDSEIAIFDNYENYGYIRDYIL